VSSSDGAAALVKRRTTTPPHNMQDGSSLVTREGNEECGPELLLTPIDNIMVTKRDESPVRRASIKSQPIASPNRRHGTQDDDSSLNAAYSIPVADILLVDISAASDSSDTANKQQRRGSQVPRHDLILYITTVAIGYFEFQCLNQNGYDILLAFLKASLAPERVTTRSRDGLNRDGRSGGAVKKKATASRDVIKPLPSYSMKDASHQYRHNTRKNYASEDDDTVEDCGAFSRPSIRSSSSVTSCLDVDALTAAHLKGRADSETWPEKMSRRVGKVVNSLQELSGTFCDLSTCCTDEATQSPGRRRQSRDEASSPHRGGAQFHTGRGHGHSHSTLPTIPSPGYIPTGDTTPFHYSDLELDDNDSQLPMSTSHANAQAVGRAQTTSPRQRYPSAPDRRTRDTEPPHVAYELSRKVSC